MAYDHQNCRYATVFKPLHKHIVIIFNCSTPVADSDIVQTCGTSVQHAERSLVAITHCACQRD